VCNSALFRPSGGSADQTLVSLPVVALQTTPLHSGLNISRPEPKRIRFSVRLECSLDASAIFA
jgi:hypothetical protein